MCTVFACSSVWIKKIKGNVWQVWNAQEIRKSKAKAVSQCLRFCRNLTGATSDIAFQIAGFMNHNESSWAGIIGLFWNFCVDSNYIAHICSYMWLQLQKMRWHSHDRNWQSVFSLTIMTLCADSLRCWLMLSFATSTNDFESFVVSCLLWSFHVDW